MILTQNVSKQTPVFNGHPLFKFGSPHDSMRRRRSRGRGLQPACLDVSSQRLLLRFCGGWDGEGAAEDDQ